MKISVYPSLVETSQCEEIDLAQLVNKLTQDVNIKAKIDSLREAMKVNQWDLHKPEHKQLYQNEKFKTLPLFTFAGVFPIRQSERIEHYNFGIMLDFDDLTVEQLNALYAISKEDETVIISFISPSGNGLKIAHLLDEEMFHQFYDTLDFKNFNSFHKICFNKLSECYLLKGFEVDENGGDLSRACFFSSVETLHFNESPIPFKFESNLLKKVITTSIVAQHYAIITKIDHTDSLPLIQDIIEWLKRKRYSITGSYDEWFQTISCLKKAFPNDVALGLAQQFSRLDTSYNEKIFLKKFNNSFDPERTPPLDMILKRAMALGYKPKLKSSSMQNNAFINALVQHHKMYRYNTFMKFIQRFDLDEQIWKNFEDEDLSDIYVHVFAMTYKQSDLIAILESTVPRYDPIQDFVSSLPTYDGADHIKLLAGTIRCENDELTELFLRKWLTSFFYGLLDRQGYNENVLVLQGPQNIGKTRWVNKLCSPYEAQYEKHNLNPNDKDDRLQLCTSFVVFMDEMTTVIGTQNHFDAFKQMLSSEKFNIRKPYGRMRQEYRRKGSVIGAINRGEFLRDLTGNRRWWIIQCNELNFKHNIDMWQVYAQAYHMYKNGYQHWFQGDEYEALNIHNATFEITDSVEEILKKYVITDNSCFMSCTEIIQEINHLAGEKLIDLEKANRVGTLLSKNNYNKAKVKNKRGYRVRIKLSGVVEDTASESQMSEGVVSVTNTEKILSVTEALASYGLDNL